MTIAVNQSSKLRLQHLYVRISRLPACVPGADGNYNAVCAGGPEGGRAPVPAADGWMLGRACVHNMLQGVGGAASFCGMKCGGDHGSAPLLSPPRLLTT